MPVYFSSRVARNGNSYFAIYVDLGYRKVNLCMDKSLIVEILDLPFSSMVVYTEASPLLLAKINIDK